jgi:hypothetical protein
VPAIIAVRSVDAVAEEQVQGSGLTLDPVVRVRHENLEPLRAPDVGDAAQDPRGEDVLDVRQDRAQRVRAPFHDGPRRRVDAVAQLLGGQVHARSGRPH